MIKTDVPTFDHVTISGKTIKCRPFLVKEEKLFLIAMESDDPQDLYRTTIQVLENCVLEDKFKVDELPFFEIDFLILHLRAESIGNSIKMTFRCSHMIEDKPCGHLFEDNISFKDVSVHDENVIDGKFQFGDVGIELSYPSYATMQNAANTLDDMQQKIDILSYSINKIWNKETVYQKGEITRTELVEFIDNLTKEQYNQLQKFIDGSPWLSIEKQVTCPKCKHQDLIEYEGFESFFA